MRVAAAITLDEKLVVVRHRAGASSYHLLPGGGVDYRETVEAALKREVAEETGLVVEMGRPLLISDTIDPEGPRHVVNLTFSARVTGGTLLERSGDPRVEAVELVDPATLSMLDLRPPMTKALLAHLADPHREAEYLGSLFTPGR